MNVFSVYSRLHNPLVSRMRKVIVRSTVLELLIYSVTAVFGCGFRTHAALVFNRAFCSYLTFHDMTEDNVLKNYSSSDALFVACRLCVGTSACLTFPLYVDPCRASLLVSAASRVCEG